MPESTNHEEGILPFDLGIRGIGRCGDISSGVIEIDFGSSFVAELAGAVVLASKTASQQKVPLFHNRQLKFSNLRPSSIDEADRETANMLIFVCGPSSKKDAHPSTI